MRHSLTLLVLLIGLSQPAWAGTLNDQFTFDEITYTISPSFDVVSGNGSGGQFEGMGDMTLLFQYSRDPDGGHPLGRTIRFDGVIPELGITEESLLFAGVILDDPTVFPGFLRFNIAEDLVHPALEGFTFGNTWDVPLPTSRVPSPATGLLLTAGATILVARRLSRRSWSTSCPPEGSRVWPMKGSRLA